MNELTLYHAVPSRGLIVRWMLEEIGEPYDVKILDFSQAEQKCNDYLDINPLGRVPALSHRGNLLTESAAICLYLAETFPEANLNIDSGSPLRAEFLRWIFFGPASAEPAMVWHSMAKQTEHEFYKPYSDIKDVSETLKTALQGKQYLVGNKFTAADIVIGCTIMWGAQLLGVMPKCEVLCGYWRHLTNRPAWLRAQAFDRDHLDQAC